MSSALQRPPARGRLARPSAFDAATYSEWVRGAILLRDDHPDMAVLFESTISEPTPQLTDVIRDSFGVEPTSRYVSVFAGGNPFAVAAVARRYGVGEDQVMTTTGASSALALALRALVRPGDHVLVERPGFDLLGQLAAEAGAEVEALDRAAPAFDLDLEALRMAVRPNTRALMLTNLHNPSGVRLSDETLLAAAECLGKVAGVLLVDEVYADFAGDRSGSSAVDLAPNILAASSLTKVFGLFALKFGWLLGDRELMERVRRAAPDGDPGASKLTHALAARVLEAPAPFEAHWRSIMGTARPVLERRVAAMRAEGLLEGDIPPFGPMYYPRLPGISDTRAFAARAWRDHALLVAPGEFFGLPGHIRIGFGVEPAGLDDALGRLHLALRQAAAER